MQTWCHQQRKSQKLLRPKSLWNLMGKKWNKIRTSRSYLSETIEMSTRGNILSFIQHSIWHFMSYVTQRSEELFWDYTTWIVWLYYHSLYYWLPLPSVLLRSGNTLTYKKPPKTIHPDLTDPALIFWLPQLALCNGSGSWSLTPVKSVSKHHAKHHQSQSFELTDKNRTLQVRSKFKWEPERRCTLIP